MPATVDQVLAQIERPLTSAVRRACPSHMDADVDDVTQHALLRVHRALETAEGARSLAPAYLWRVAQTAMVDQLRKNQSRQRLWGRFAEVQTSRPQHEPCPETSLAEREIGRAIEVALETLIESRRRAVVLHLQGHPIREIAELLGGTAKRAENLVYRGLADLRARLTRMGLEP